MEDKEDILKKSHQEYVDWWLPIDVENGSIMSLFSFNNNANCLNYYSESVIQHFCGYHTH
jgi:hypothetical protein